MARPAISPTAPVHPPCTGPSIISLPMIDTANPITWMRAAQSSHLICSRSSVPPRRQRITSAMIPAGTPTKSNTMKGAVWPTSNHSALPTSPHGLSTELMK